MTLDWRTLDRWLMGEAWTGSRISTHLDVLCDQIGERWSSSPAEIQTVTYLRDQFAEFGLDHVAIEEFMLDTWRLHHYSATVQAPTIDREKSQTRAIDLLPFNRCPSCRIEAPLVDAGFGTARELAGVAAQLPGSIALVAMAMEPFSTPIALGHRLHALAEAGAAAALVIERKSGRRMEYHTATDWRDHPGLDDHPIPTAVTSREDGAYLRKLAKQGHSLRLEVESEFYCAPSYNVVAELRGERWPEEHLLLGGHHDTVFGTAGGNDNASGVIAVLETARLLAELRRATGVGPGCTIRFATFAAEEQKLQGSAALVAEHYEQGTKPRLAINLDELSAGNIKGLVLAFPHLRNIIQQQFDQMGDGLKCHVMSQLDPTSDHYSFLAAGIEAAHLWRWRFVGRHADADFHHEPGDSADKVNVRELKEYGGQLARLLLRLSHIAPHEWPANPLTREDVQRRLASEHGQVIRVF